MKHPSRARHRGYQKKLATESLEQRRLLTAVLSVSPTSDAPSSVAPVISVTFDAEINPASVLPSSLVVHGSMSGPQRHAMTVDGQDVTLSFSEPFHPGEVIQVTVAAEITNVDGEPLDAAFVWQFRTATSGGTGIVDKRWNAARYGAGHHGRQQSRSIAPARRPSLLRRRECNCRA